MGSHIITPNSITIFTDSPHTFSKSSIPEHVFGEVVEALNDNDYEAALDKLSPRKTIESFFAGSGEAPIRNGQVYVGEAPVDNYAARKAVEFAQAGLPYQPLLRFVERVRRNPSYRAVQELYQFLEAGELPLDSDGCFKAYKKVHRKEAGDLVDIYTRSIDNSPGAVVEMPRNEVDEDPDRTCSRGLHVCTHAYLPYFGCGGSDAVVAVTVDPQDVVAVPRDYDNAKMRVCRYVVHDVIEWHVRGEDDNPLRGLFFEDDVEDEDEDDDEDDGDLVLRYIDEDNDEEYVDIDDIKSLREQGFAYLTIDSDGAIMAWNSKPEWDFGDWMHTTATARARRVGTATYSPMRSSRCIWSTTGTPLY